MPYSLIKFAYENGIAIEYWDFKYPIEAVYFCETQPIIALSNSLFCNRAHLRTILLEELGHHFTSTGNCIIKARPNYRDMLEVGRKEHIALAWGARFIMPVDKLEKAYAHGLRYTWELAEHFEVDESLVKLRLILYFEREKQGA